MPFERAFIPSVPFNIARHRQNLPDLSAMSNRRNQPQWAPHGVPMNTRSSQFKPAATARKATKFYAVRRGRNNFKGILTAWPECQALVHGFPGAIYKSFKTMEGARAFLAVVDSPTTKTNKSKNNNNNNTPANHAKPSNRASTQLKLTGPYTGTRNRTSLPPEATNAPTADSDPTNELYTCTQAEELAAAAVDPSDEAAPEVIVYTDGACSNNGRPNARAGYGVYFGKESPYNVSAPLKDKPTNQRAEMTAVLEAMRIVLDHGLVAKDGKLVVYTDSRYTREGMDSWVAGWKAKGWLTAGGDEVRNKEIWIALDACRKALSIKNITVVIEWVRGHSGVPGNEAADRLAVAGMWF